MRAVLKTGQRAGFDYTVDHPEPSTGPRDVLVEVAAVSVCGTDRELYEWTPSAEAFGLRLPVVVGHECAGTVLETGPDVRHLRAGDRVALETHLACGRCFPCRTGDGHNCAEMAILGMHIDGGFAERMAVPADACFRLPDALPTAAGALLEPAGVAVHAIQRSGLALGGRSVLVNGCGPIGLVLARLSQVMGATDIVVVEPNPYRRGLAEALGVTVLSPGDPIAETCRELTGARGGCDVAFEVSAAPDVLPGLFESVRREGVVVTIGHPSEPAEVDVATYINKKGITLRGVFGRRLWDTWETLIALVRSGALDLENLVTHRLPLTEVDQAIRLLSGEACKVIIEPQREV